MSNENAEDKKNKLDEFFTGPKKYLPIAILLVLTLIAALFLFGVFDKEESENPGTETSSAAPSSSVPNNEPEGGQPPPVPEPENESPSEPAQEEAVPDDNVAKVADEFYKKLSSGKGGTDLANDIKNISSSALYESLKVSDPKAIPEGADDLKVSGNGPWKATVTNKEGKELYTMDIAAYQKDDTVVPLVEAINIPSTNEVTYNEEGYPVPPPIQPFSADSYQGMYVNSLGVAKAYLEFKAGDDPKKREAAVKAAVNGGKYPALRPYTPEDGGVVKMYSPQGMRTLNAASGDKVDEGVISVVMKATYADANQADPQPVETLNLVVDFKWDKTAKMWKPSQLRLA